MGRYSISKPLTVAMLTVVVVVTLAALRHLQEACSAGEQGKSPFPGAMHHIQRRSCNSVCPSIAAFSASV